MIWPYKDKTLIKEADLKRDYPLTYEYLSANRERLEKRKNVNIWYEIQNPGFSKPIDNPKILIGWKKDGGYSFDKHGKFLFIGGGKNSAVSSRNKLVSNEALLAILCSTTVREYLNTVESRGSQYGVTAIRAIPIPLPTAQNLSIFGELTNKAKQILDGKLSGKERSTLEKEVDELVRDLYGIPAENAEPQKLQEAEELKPAAQLRPKYLRKPVAARLRRVYHPEPLEDGICSCLSSMMVA